MPDDYIAPVAPPTGGKRRRYAIPAIVGAVALSAGMWVGAAYERRAEVGPGAPTGEAEAEECVPIALNAPGTVTRAPGSSRPEITRITRLPNGEWPKGDKDAVVRSAMPVFGSMCPSSDDDDVDREHTPGPSFPGATVRR